MKSIPLYDASVPIVCTAHDDEVPKRIVQIERLRDHLTRVDRTEHGLVLHFASTSEVEADVRRFAADEKGCCQFWGFEVDATGDALTLRWDGPPDVAEFLDRLHLFLLGNEPLTAETGLL
jgi:hypothetical protein